MPAEYEKSILFAVLINLLLLGSHDKVYNIHVWVLAKRQRDALNYGAERGNNYGEIRRKANKFRSVTDPQMISFTYT